MALLEQHNLGGLRPDERLELIAELWDSLEDKNLPLTVAQRDELDRRYATLEADLLTARSWEEVKAEMERRCP